MSDLDSQSLQFQNSYDSPDDSYYIHPDEYDGEDDDWEYRWKGYDAWLKRKYSFDFPHKEDSNGTS